MRQVPQLFTSAQMLIISDMADTRVGSITAPMDRYMEWKTTDGSYESTALADFQTLFDGMFEKNRLIDIISDFTLSMGSDTKKARILAGYHQYFAVKKALRCTQEALGKKTVKSECSGTRRGVARVCRWCFTRINCSKTFSVPPSSF